MSFLSSLPHTQSDNYQTWSGPLFLCTHSQFWVSLAIDKVWVVHMCDSVYIKTLFHMYRQSGKLNVFFELTSTHTVWQLPNLIRTFVLVYTFTILSFVSYRQSMGRSHVWEHVHKDFVSHVSVKWQIECLFWAHFHTHSLTTTKLDQDLCFSVHIHNSEFR